MSEPRTRWRALGALLRPDLRRWVVLGALVAAAAALGLAGPLVVRRIIDQASHGATVSTLAWMAGLYLILAAVAQILDLGGVWAATTSAWKTTNGIRVTMARHVLGLDHEFHRTHTPGELIQRVDGDVTAVSNFLSLVVPKALGALFLVTGMVGVLAVLDWRLAIGALGYLAGLAVTLRRGRHRAVREMQDEMSALAKLYGGIEERLTASEDLRALGASQHAMSRFVDESAGAMATSVNSERAFIGLWWRIQGALSVGHVIALVTAAILVPRGTITLGTAFLLLQYVDLMERPLADMINQLEVVQKASGAMIRVVDLLERQSTIADTGTTPWPPGAPTIEFGDVSLRYAGDDEAVLEQVDLVLPAGQTVGVVGRSGSGKTTLSRLVLRLVEATTGEVRLGGVPIADLPLAELRGHVALIPQEVELFGGTVRDNVTLFAAADDADVAEALRRAGLPELATDLDRPLAAGGTGLSAGEAQLIALARVWLRNPDLIVLDEATARIDPQTEARINAAVAELCHGRTVVIIAHRLSTLSDVDRIVVVDDGRVVEHGERSALAADHDSHFARLLRVGLEVDRDTVG